MLNWKTTIAGIIAGSIPILQGISDSMGAGVPIKWLPILMGLAIMALGVVAKDITTVAKVLVIGFAVTNATACGILTPGAKSPCDGLYCLSVDAAGVPGEALICYSTRDQAIAAKATLERQGKKATLVK